MSEARCNCPHIDGFVIIRRDCPHHPEAAARRALARDEVAAEVVRDPDAIDAACAWSDYRKDYGVSAASMKVAHQAFLAGWKAAREGDQSAALR